MWVTSRTSEAPVIVPGFRFVFGMILQANRAIIAP